MPGMWSGGVVGLKSILGVKRRTEALEIMNTLSRFGYIRYTLDEKTKKLEYVVTDWVVKCSGAECMSGAVYATDGYGFLCLPRNITQRLADQHYTFGESDAWLDLWCHTVCQETGNAFSYLAPAVQFGRLGAALTLEALARIAKYLPKLFFISRNVFLFIMDFIFQTLSFPHGLPFNLIDIHDMFIFLYLLNGSALYGNDTVCHCSQCLIMCNYNDGFALFSAGVLQQF